MKRIIGYVETCVLLLGASLAAAQPETTVPQERLLPEWRAERHADQVAQARTGRAELVLLGDSITHYWERHGNYAKSFAPYAALNLGMGGARTETVLWRLQNGALDGISPRLVTLMLGTNNSKKDTPEDIFAGIQAVVKELRTRLPESKVVVFSIFPRKPGPEYEVVQAVNALLPKIADGDRVQHIDINPHFLDEVGDQRPELYGRDLLHLSNQGYEVWWKALQPILEGAGLQAAHAGPATALTEEEPLNPSPPVIRLWPIERVGGEQNRLKELYRDRKGTPQLCGVKDPNLTVHQADSAGPTPAVIYCPGGAYKVLGPQPKLIQWLNEHGITVFMLKYTIPDNPDAAFEDVQRAMRLVRHQASKWNINPERIGVVGQSAGGHLSARLSQNYLEPAYSRIDDADKESCEPNFAILISAAYLLGHPPGPTLNRDLFPMTGDIAPTFLVYAEDDKFCKGGEAYDAALREAGGSSRIRLYEKGGHGLGGVDWYPVATDWLKAQNIIP